ncbi:MAG TPA: hypothetical protein VG711_06310, partial [Phycisphaerales bacterium]|nr:hypothetical protein [Phycisphaerales bacterium]
MLDRSRYPLPVPNRYGYCYASRSHFDLVMLAVAKRLLRKSGLLRDRFIRYAIPLSWVMIIAPSIFS